MAFSTAYATKTPYGTITIWYGALDALPKGWHLCDGTGSTPDLRDRFVVGAGNSYAKGAIGGEATHTLSVDEMPSHQHGAAGAHTHKIKSDGNGSDYGLDLTIVGNQKFPITDPGYIETAPDHQHSATGGDAAHENRPPYYALAYIMKI